MERLTEYLERKNAELRWIASRLAHPPRLPEARSPEDVLALKLGLRARLLAELIVKNPWLTETNLRVQVAHEVPPLGYQYKYQRFHLITSSPLIHPTDAPVVTSQRFTSSGMGAIYPVLTALSRVREVPSTLVGRSDAYYESREVVVELPMLFWVEAGERDDLAALLARQHEGHRTLLVDSITVTDDAPLFERLEPGDVDLLLVDTTCWPVQSDRVSRAIDAAVRLGVPAVLVRSHQKLDFLGVELGRLGSMTFVDPVSLEPEVARRSRAIQEMAAHVARLTGSAAAPYHLHPILFDEDLRGLNATRLERLTRTVAHAVERLVASGLPGVRTFHHGLFFAVPLFPSDETSGDRLTAAIEQLVIACRAARLPVRRADSFGFDVITLAGLPHEGREGLRVSTGDVPAEVIEPFADILARWTRAFRGLTR